ncbi:Rap1a/Tai family immunity protein [Pseudomonas graminis]|uniref:Rap1a/Tai family immunity protein n=1 Tax=Pseudomonas graminis TaxID=158627 RepID=UPI003D767910
MVLAFAPMTAWCATGNDLRAWGEGYEKNTGTFANGLYMGFVVGVAESFSGLGFCPPSNVTNGQNAAIVWKWLSDHPKDWAGPASGLILAALSDAFPCQKK